MSADLLRRAAETLRQHAQAATWGSWEVGPTFGARDNSVYVRPEGGFDWVGTTFNDNKIMTCQVPNVPEFRANAAFIALMHPPVALALADLLDEQSKRFEENTIVDMPDCPNCGTACAGHPEATWCDHCGCAVESKDYDDACECWTKVFALARAILREPQS